MLQKVSSEPRPGRYCLHSIQDSRRIVRLARNNPNWTFRRSQQDTGIDLCHAIIQKILQLENLIYWRFETRLHLTEAHANLRRQWAISR
ncbi:hypothetical protein M433DRAFT_184445 [Acidomyces richmondensis BFW]|nr:MAG: hypothetical protein FE78DRAFT_339749 [Acidomyces sp. 'richmondensis']KYG46794.1 hypothetical protein M433DRAFT_184445 [Acidomyces richmondensis BFW]